MNSRSAELRKLAAAELEKADAATLPLVKDRALRAAAAWESMAAVAERVETGGPGEMKRRERQWRT